MPLTALHQIHHKYSSRRHDVCHNFCNWLSRRRGSKFAVFYRPCILPLTLCCGVARSVMNNNSVRFIIIVICYGVTYRNSVTPNIITKILQLLLILVIWLLFNRPIFQKLHQIRTKPLQVFRKGTFGGLLMQDFIYIFICNSPM